MIHDEPVISLEISAIYEGADLINYEVQETREYGAKVRSFFVNKTEMKNYIKDTIRGI